MRITHFTRTAKSAKGKLALTLFSALVVLGLTGVTLFGAAAKSPFTLSATPASQTVTAGQTATFVVAIKRDAKFTGPVNLSVSGLPSSSKMTPAFSANPASGSTASSTLTIQTNVNGTTPAANYPFTITGTSGSSSSTTSATLTVVSQTAPSFSLVATPSSRVVSEDDTESYSIGISRTDFPGSVALAASGLPKDVAAEFMPPSTTGNSATLVITTVKPKAGTYPITITGTGTAGSQQITRSTSVSLIVEEKRPFVIEGNLIDPVGPGTPARLDLRLTNPHNFTLRVRELSVAVDEHTSSPGCSGGANFSVQQYTGPDLLLPPNTDRTLTDLQVPESAQPTVVMEDSLTRNQDACKNVQLYLRYSGRATR